MFSYPAHLRYLLIKGLTLILGCTQIIVPSAFAANDFIAPTITHEPFSQPVAEGDVLKIQATVKDNQAVATVLLHYRLTGTKDYQQIPMTAVGNTPVYQVTLPQTDIRQPGIEYYIQATDHAENSVIRGLSSRPLTLSVIARPDPPATATMNTELPVLTNIPEDKTRDSKPSSKTWLWIGLGVLTAALVAGASGGGGSSSTNATDPGNEAGSISISVSAPLPQ